MYDNLNLNDNDWKLPAAHEISPLLDLSKVDCQLIVDLYGRKNSKSNSKYYLKPRLFNDFGEGCLLWTEVDHDHPVEC